MNNEPKSKQRNGPIYFVDFTIPRNESYSDSSDVIKVCKEWFKKWVFQLERGDQSGYVHWQGRGSLIKKARVTSLYTKLFGPGAHISATSSNCLDGGTQFSYVTKGDTRIDGPWKDSDPEPPKRTRQLTGFLENELRPWQQQVLMWCHLTDDRSIRLIYDPVGNSGKSIFSEFLEYKRLAFEMPPFRQMEDILACAIDNIMPAYIIDMPRGMKKDKLGEFYSGLEALKNGVAYDKRYKFRKVRFDRPQVIVFTNVLPAFELMSKDRWCVYEMCDDYSLNKRSI